MSKVFKIGITKKNNEIIEEVSSIEVLANNQRLTYEKINHIVNKIKKPLRGS